MRRSCGCPIPAEFKARLDGAWSSLGWGEMRSEVPPNPNRSVVLWFHQRTQTCALQSHRGHIQHCLEQQGLPQSSAVFGGVRGVVLGSSLCLGSAEAPSQSRRLLCSSPQSSRGKSSPVGGSALAGLGAAPEPMSGAGIVEDGSAR